MFNQKTKNAIRIICFLSENQDDDKKYGAIAIAKELELKTLVFASILFLIPLTLAAWMMGESSLFVGALIVIILSASTELLRFKVLCHRW